MVSPSLYHLHDSVAGLMKISSLAYLCQNLISLSDPGSIGEKSKSALSENSSFPPLQSETLDHKMIDETNGMCSSGTVRKELTMIKGQNRLDTSREDDSLNIKGMFWRSITYFQCKDSKDNEMRRCGTTGWLFIDDMSTYLKTSTCYYLRCNKW